MTPGKDKVYCASCNTELDEASHLTSDERKPCPNCGSLARRHAKDLSSGQSFTSTSKITERLSAADVTADDIRQLIRVNQRELNELEFKRSPDADLLKAACAIANFGGGFILIGVDEDQNHCAVSIIHVHDVQAVCDSVRQRLRDGLSPRPVIEVVALGIDAADIIVIRVAPQNGPHMVSSDKRSDFYGRYDATSERMRYEEIEQRFRDKLAPFLEEVPATPRVELETVEGRRAATAGATGALDQFTSRLIESKVSLLGLVAVCDLITDAINEDVASHLMLHPTYERQGGWLVIHPSLGIERTSGSWKQDYAEVSSTFLTSSGDLIFQKRIDEVLCWRQSPIDFERAPRFYSNAVVEYCLSFSYALADIAAWTQPSQILIRTLLSNASGSVLPLGEGGTVWFDAPQQVPKPLGSDEVVSTVIAAEAKGVPLRVRSLAFKLAKEVYAFFGYLERQVPFSSKGKILFDADSETSRLAAVKSYLQGALSTLFEKAAPEISRGVTWFHSAFRHPAIRVAVTDELLEDFASDEDALFVKLDKMGLSQILKPENKDRAPLLTSEYDELKWME